VIDLHRNVLKIGDTTTPFLDESDLPEYARLNSLPNDAVPMDEDRQLAEALQRSATDAAPHGTHCTYQYHCLQCFDALLVGRQEWRLACEELSGGVLVCLERGADLHMVQLMPLPLTVSCFTKIQIGFTFLVPAHLGSHGKKGPLNGCVCNARKGWLGSRVVGMLNSGAEGPGFILQPRRCRVTVLGKLFTPVVPLFTKQQNW